MNNQVVYLMVHYGYREVSPFLLMKTANHCRQPFGVILIGTYHSKRRLSKFPFCKKANTVNDAQISQESDVIGGLKEKKVHQHNDIIHDMCLLMQVYYILVCVHVCGFVIAI